MILETFMPLLVMSFLSTFSNNRTFQSWKTSNSPFNLWLHFLSSFFFLSSFLWHISFFTFSNRILSFAWYSEYFLLYPQAKCSILVPSPKLRVLHSFSSFTLRLFYHFFFERACSIRVKENDIKKERVE